MQPTQGRGHVLVCASCGLRREDFSYTCDRCDAPLLAVLEPLTSPPSVGARPGLWRWSDLLPVSDTQITLGEGDTPNVPLSVLSSHHAVHAKLESLNPTLSFKDRAMALAASYACDHGFKGLVVASTGNAAVSAAAYAAAAGLGCQIIVGKASQAWTKLAASRRLGADVVEVDGDYSDAYEAAARLEGPTSLNVSTTYRNPILAEAYRTISFELLAELGGRPDLVIVPIGAGPLLRGIGQGFRDAVSLGMIDVEPVLVGVQTASVAPVARAWHERFGRAVGLPAPPEVSGPTVATAIADPLRGYYSHAAVTIDAVSRSCGAVVAVTETEILAATNRLLSSGIWVEPSSATALAALDHPFVRNREPGTAVLILTGHGIKSTAPGDAA